MYVENIERWRLMLWKGKRINTTAEIGSHASKNGLMANPTAGITASTSSRRILGPRTYCSNAHQNTIDTSKASASACRVIVSRFTRGELAARNNRRTIVQVQRTF